MQRYQFHRLVSSFQASQTKCRPRPGIANIERILCPRQVASGLHCNRLFSFSFFYFIFKANGLGGMLKEKTVSRVSRF